MLRVNMQIEWAEKQALKALANRHFNGNLSALILHTVRKGITENPTYACQHPLGTAPDSCPVCVLHILAKAEEIKERARNNDAV